MKIAIVGSRHYENTRKIRDLLTNLKNKFGNDLTIISGGSRDGADQHVKKYALEFGLRYEEYNPAYTPRNLYSAMPEEYYGKTYHVSQYHHRNMLIAKACDKMIALIPSNMLSEGTESAIQNAKKFNKPVVILT
jgi:predicted Rossmann-fold nucleotide-binding protein